MNKIVMKEEFQDKYKKETEQNKNEEKNIPKVKYSISCLFPNTQVRDIVMGIAKELK